MDTCNVNVQRNSYVASANPELRNMLLAFPVCVFLTILYHCKVSECLDLISPGMNNVVGEIY